MRWDYCQGFQICLLSASPPAVTSPPQSFASLSKKQTPRCNQDRVPHPNCVCGTAQGKPDLQTAASAPRSDSPCIQPLADPLFFPSLTRRHVESSLCCFHLTAAASAAADKAARTGEGSASCAMPPRRRVPGSWWCSAAVVTLLGVPQPVPCHPNYHALGPSLFTTVVQHLLEITERPCLNISTRFSVFWFWGIHLPSVESSPGHFHLLCSSFSKEEIVELRAGGEMEHLGL